MKEMEFQVKFLRGQQRETLFQIETHLVTENALGPRARTVLLLHAFVKDALEKV